MAVPISKPELLAAISTTFDKLIADLAQVPHARSRETSLTGHASGTLMSPAVLIVIEN